MYLGLDFGTSAARACVVDETEIIVYQHHITYPEPEKQTPLDWREALHTHLKRLPGTLAAELQGIAIAATSATVLLCDEEMEPISSPLLYFDSRAQQEAEQLKQIAPPGHIVCSATSGLAKFLWLTQNTDLSHCAHFLHQADWLAALLTGAGGSSDYHNALKTGFDVERLCWPHWVQQLSHSTLLPHVVAPGTPLGRITPTLAQYFKINPACTIHAGTTDSIAAFIATGTNEPGAAVTSLGTTLVLKILSTQRVEAAEFGIYSHRYGDLWLTGGASNAGGSVLRQHFSDQQLVELSPCIVPGTDSPLDYYPLPRRGERFPINDPNLVPRLTPRPMDDTQFLHGLLQGLCNIEAAGYRKLREFGASSLKYVISTGGGAKNQTWQQMRERTLGVPVTVAQCTDASFGAALLAKQCS